MIAPLDWGLGHTTRCLPIIDLLLRKGHSVSLAGPRKILDFVAATFPEIRQFSLEGYQIRYSKHKAFFAGRIILQVPKILKAIRREHQWLQQIQAKEQFDLVISDNRYGLHHSTLPCVIMTHQLMIKSGRGKMIDRQLQKLHYRFLEKFRACWIIDEAGANNLSGELAHPAHLPGNARYIGILSQMTLSPLPEQPFKGIKEKPEILILLSGPEPMRSRLEAELLPQCKALSERYHFNFVAGNIQAGQPSLPANGSFRYFQKLSATDLAPLLHTADLVICRSGYSTLMDLAVLGKKAMLIPTPGQTEQEYLARYLQRKFQTAVAQQGHVILTTAIPPAFAQKAITVPTASMTRIDAAVRSVI
ncbi:MAG TPA: glycosyltransferase [Edaphocola sp.]|nr:glycosyltransferase [Edaphocola sp.]